MSAWGEMPAGTVTDNEPGSLRTFYFTFGIGQRLISHSTGFPADTDQTGISLAGCYVKITAESDDAARAEMMRLWGRSWSGQYNAETFPAIRDRYDMRELTIIARRERQT